MRKDLIDAASSFGSERHGYRERITVCTENHILPRRDLPVDRNGKRLTWRTGIGGVQAWQQELRYAVRHHATTSGAIAEYRRRADGRVEVVPKLGGTLLHGAQGITATRTGIQTHCCIYLLTYQQQAGRRAGEADESRARCRCRAYRIVVTEREAVTAYAAARRRCRRTHHAGYKQKQTRQKTSQQGFHGITPVSAEQFTAPSRVSDRVLAGTLKWQSISPSTARAFNT